MRNSRCEDMNITNSIIYLISLPVRAIQYTAMHPIKTLVIGLAACSLIERAEAGWLKKLFKIQDHHYCVEKTDSYGLPLSRYTCVTIWGGEAGRMTCALQAGPPNRVSYGSC